MSQRMTPAAWNCRAPARAVSPNLTFHWLHIMNLNGSVSLHPGLAVKLVLSAILS